MQAGTRSAVKDIIRKKRVTINGEVITRPEIKVDIDKDVVAVDNNVLGYSEYEYYMLNKPAGVVSAVSDKDFKTVVELITDNKRKDFNIIRDFHFRLEDWIRIQKDFLS